jgi:hypothetical protein
MGLVLSEARPSTNVTGIRSWWKGLGEADELRSFANAAAGTYGKFGTDRGDWQFAEATRKLNGQPCPFG